MKHFVIILDFINLDFFRDFWYIIMDFTQLPKEILEKIYQFYLRARARLLWRTLRSFIKLANISRFWARRALNPITLLEWSYYSGLDSDAPIWTRFRF